jgi:hypothetical protein
MTHAVETRWIILCSNGQHSTIGRHRDPEESDIEKAREGLAAAGLSGWLAILKGGYYTRARGELLMVRPLGDDPGSWEQAVAAFQAIRQESSRAA